MVEFYHSVNQYFKKTKQKQNTQSNPPNQKKKHYRAIFFKFWEV